MPKIPDCDRCQYFANSPHIVCGIHPYGPTEEICEDFVAVEEDPEAEVRQPLGGGYYAGDWIPQPFPALTTAEQLSFLDEHPQFTGRCPNCEMPIAEAVEEQWMCDHCEWKDVFRP